MADAGKGKFNDPILKRFARAEAKRRLWDGILREAYDLALPTHEPTQAEKPEGAARDREIFDGTAVRALDWKRAKLHGDLFPPFRHWTSFSPNGQDAESLSDEEQRQWKAWADPAENAFHKAIDRSNFHLEMPLALGDALISTGALLIQAGTPEDPLRFEAVPIGQVVPEESPDGTIRTVFRVFDVPGRDITERWDDAKIPADKQQRIKDDPDAAHKIVEATVWDPKAKRFDYTVILCEGEHRIVERKYPTSPWVVFRMDKATGETMGRGPVMKVRADVATANKTKELILKNASIAVAGLWQAEDDGVLNPANIRLVPGAIIPKAPGSEGLKPLESPGRFDVSQVVLQDLQQNIDAGIKGPQLPPIDEGGRTAYEIGERRADQIAVDLPMSLRLLTECQAPIVRRCLAILMSPAMAGSPYHIEPLLFGERAVEPVPTSPLAAMQDIADAQQQMQAYAMALQVDPETVSVLVDRAAFLREYLSVNGFAEKHLRNLKEVAAEQQQNKAMAMARATAEAVGKVAGKLDPQEAI
jgi:hypothetical protein